MSDGGGGGTHGFRTAPRGPGDSFLVNFLKFGSHKLFIGYKLVTTYFIGKINFMTMSKIYLNFEKYR